MNAALSYAVFVGAALGLIFSVIAGFRVVAGIGRRRRNAVMRAFAQKRGLRCEANDAALATLLALFPWIPDASPGVEHVVRWDDFTLVVYTFQDEGPTTWKMLFADAGAFRLPSFSIRGGSWLDEALSPDIDFLDDPVFSKGFVLEGSDEAAVRALFTPGVRAEFLNDEHSSNIHCIDSKLLFIHGDLTNVSDLESFVDESLRIYRRFAVAGR